MKRPTQAFVTIFSATALAAGAYAATNQAAPQVNDASAAFSANVSLAQAVQAAEASAGGKATHAEFEQSKTHGAIYEVEVARADQQVFDVRVSADSGQILSSQADHADHADHADGEEENEES